jgi:ribose/xylose/arabinose/galactoside ABC-type transport system permease subunit
MTTPSAGVGTEEKVVRRLRGVLGAELARQVWRAAPQYGLLIGFVVLCAILSVASPYFLTTQNLLNVALQAAVVAVLGFGQTFVVLTRGIDLSVGSVLALSGAVMATNTAGRGALLGILIGLLAAALLGTVNGLFVTVAKVAPFIATLAMLAIGRGLTYVYTQGAPVGVHTTGFTFWGQGTIATVPVPVIVMLTIFLVSLGILTQTRFGRYVYAIGSNPEVTRLSGIPINRYVVAVYAISGLLAGVGGLILTGRLASADPNSATGYELDVIAAVVIGGTSLFGGRGGVFGTLVGALIVSVVANGLVLLNVNPFWTQAIKGAIILLAVLADSIKRKSWYE